MANKFEYNHKNKSVLHKLLKKLKEAIKMGDKKAVEALAWLAKGLIMKGSDEAGDIVEDVSMSWFSVEF